MLAAECGYIAQEALQRLWFITTPIVLDIIILLVINRLLRPMVGAISIEDLQYALKSSLY